MSSAQDSNGSLSGTKLQAAETAEAPKASPDAPQKSSGQTSFGDGQMIRLSPQMISANWDEIFHIIKAGNPHYESFADRAQPMLLQALGDQRLQYWAIFSKGEEPEVPLGGLTTHFSTDMFYHIKRLWLFSLYIEERFTLQFPGWKSIFEVLQNYAEANSCHEIVGFVDDSRLVKPFQRYLGVKAQSFLIKEM